MGMNTSVFEMVHQVLGDAKEKIASDASRGVEKRAAAQSQSSTKTSSMNTSKLSSDYLSKLSSACDHLATNLHLIDHHRTPQEKLAEYAAINKALMKRAFEGGDKQHQTTEADSDSISPRTVALNDSGTGVGAGNAIPSAPAMTSGESMDAGEAGEATSGNQPPKSTVPTEKPNPMDASNAMETNLGMMMPSQPEDLLKQPGGDDSNGKTASVRALRTLSKVTGQADRELREKIANAKRARVLMVKAAQSGIPQDVALSLLKKFAGDDENPAHISAGSDPALQSEPGVPSVLSQGSEAGSNTPRYAAPSAGEGGGRELLSSNESAINATKGQAKRQNHGAVSELLTEPMHSSAHDQALQESLDNTSSAGVKISAARELLKKLSSSSPKARQKIAALAKRAADEAGTGLDGAHMPPSAPMAEGGMPPEGMPEEGMPGAPSEAALAAVAAGVTPEDLLAAEAILGGETGEEPALGGAPQEAGMGGHEKLQQFGGAGGAVGASPSPTPMMG
jgi:hypothetical protein